MPMTVTLITTPSLCRICFWRRNEIALRIASSISTSNYDATTTAPFAAAFATLAPRHDVVACFEPEWNSLDVNKTRSFNILGGFETPERTVLLHSLQQGKTPDRNLAHEVVKFS